jgi:hypothetical protein
MVAADVALTSSKVGRLRRVNAHVRTHRIKLHTL